MKLRDIVRSERLRQGISQTQLGELAAGPGVTVGPDQTAIRQPKISAWESGAADMRSEIVWRLLCRLAARAGQRPSQLIRRYEEG